jgi:hypothetical protein
MEENKMQRLPYMFAQTLHKVTIHMESTHS